MKSDQLKHNQAQVNQESTMEQLQANAGTKEEPLQVNAGQRKNSQLTDQSRPGKATPVIERSLKLKKNKTNPEGAERKHRCNRTC